MLFAILDNIRSAHNVGSMFRTSDNAGVDGLFLTGYTPCPPHRKIAKTSLGAEDAIPWLYAPNALELIARMKSGQVNYSTRSVNWKFGTTHWEKSIITALEVSSKAQDLYEVSWGDSLVMVFGNEVSGVEQTILDGADVHVQIPMFGVKKSLNVACSFAVAVYEYVRCERLVKGLR